MKKNLKRTVLAFLFTLLLPLVLFAQADSTLAISGGSGLGEFLLLILLLVVTLTATIYLAYRTAALRSMIRKKDSENKIEDLDPGEKSVHPEAVPIFQKRCSQSFKKKQKKNYNLLK